MPTAPGFLRTTGFIVCGCLAAGAYFATGSVERADAAGEDPVLIPAPISLYRFDEATGATTVVDSVRGGAGLGDLYGAPTFEPGKVGPLFEWRSYTVKPGAIGKVRDGFAGAIDARREYSSQYATAPLVGDGLSEFTIAAWVKLDQTTTWGTIAKNWGEVSTGAFHFGLNNTTGRWSNFIGQVSTPSSPVSVSSPNDALLNEWQYLVTTVSQSAGKVALYENGTQVDEASFTDTIRNFSTVMSFGVKLNDAQDAPAPPTATGWLDGCLDEIAFWDVALTPAQIATVIESETGVPEEGSAEPDTEEPSTDLAGELASTGADTLTVSVLLALTGMLGAGGIAAVSRSRRAARRSTE